MAIKYFASQLRRFKLDSFVLTNPRTKLNELFQIIYYLFPAVAKEVVKNADKDTSYFKSTKIIQGIKNRKARLEQLVA